MRKDRPANHASRPTAQRLSLDKQILRPRRVVALLRFANNRKLVCEQFLAMASRISTSLPFDAENTGYDEKSVSTAPRSYQNLTCDDAGDSFFCM